LINWLSNPAADWGAWEPPFAELEDATSEGQVVGRILGMGPDARADRGGVGGVYMQEFPGYVPGQVVPPVAHQPRPPDVPVSPRVSHPQGAPPADGGATMADLLAAVAHLELAAQRETQAWAVVMDGINWNDPLRALEYLVQRLTALHEVRAIGGS